METSTHHWVYTLCVTYLKCISLFIDRGVSLATFKMYNFIIIWGENWASFGLVFEGDWVGNFILTWQHWHTCTHCHTHTRTHANTVIHTYTHTHTQTHAHTSHTHTEYTTNICLAKLLLLESAAARTPAPSTYDVHRRQTRRRCRSPRHRRGRTLHPTTPDPCQA